MNLIFFVCVFLAPLTIVLGFDLSTGFFFPRAHAYDLSVAREPGAQSWVSEHRLFTNGVSKSRPKGLAFNIEIQLEWGPEAERS